MQETWVWSLGWEAPLEKGMATHSSILAWRILWTVLSMELQRVGHDWATFTFTSVQVRWSQMLMRVDFFAVNLGSELCWLTLRHLTTLRGIFRGRLTPGYRHSALSSVLSTCCQFSGLIDHSVFLALKCLLKKIVIRWVNDNSNDKSGQMECIVKHQKNRVGMTVLE